MPNQGAPDTGHRFQDLLLQLSKQHEKEVGHLRAEVQTLRTGAALEGKRPSRQISKDEEYASLLRNAADAKAHDDSPTGSASLEGVGFTGDGEQEGQADEGPESFELKKAWTQIPAAEGSWGQELDKVMVMSQAKQLAERNSELAPETVEETLESPMANGGMRNSFRGVGRTYTRCASRLLINPASPRRMVWDLAGMALIFYDMISIPIMLSFEPDEHWFSTGMGWTTLIFWTMDVVGSVFTGFYEDGKLVMDQKLIIKSYLKGWFWIDMVVVVPDWVMKAMGSMTNIAGLARILRAARILRVLRMLRLLKLKKLLALVYDMIDSEYMWIVFSLLRLLALLLIMNHVVGCCWYLVGRLGRGSFPKNWLEDSGMTPVWGQDLTWKYLTSMHWSITQFTPASMDISATNSLERGFSIAILFWALVALSSVIGNVSASMTAIRNMGSDEMKKFWVLRRYFKQKRISRDLAERIVKYLEYECTAKKDIVPSTKVVLLGLVSENLQLELDKEMHAPLLVCHPFFNYVCDEIPALMFRLCHSAVKTAMYATNDQPFQAGDEGVNMYFFKIGLFEYKLVSGQVFDTPLGPKTWASEAVLWTMWRHRGSLTALRPSEVTEIRPASFIEVFRMHPRPWHLGQHYGRHFVEHMNDINTTVLTDVIFDHDVFETLVARSIEDIERSSKRKSWISEADSGTKSASTRDPISPARGDKVAWA